MFGRMMVSALALMSGVAHAQETPAQSAAAAAPSSDTTIYDPAFFDQFHPQNANDMVAQVPGFSLNGGDDRRGFSGAVGNLLIDGVRPVTKSQSLSGLLSQIPAKQVVRIEVLRGAAVAGDPSGLPMLLNVVRTPTAGSGQWEVGGEYNRQIFAPQPSVSWSGRSGTTEYGIGASFHSQFRSLPGTRRTYDANDRQTGFVRTPSDRTYQEASINGNYAMQLFGGRLSTTEVLDAWKFENHNALDFQTPAFVRTEYLDEHYKEHQGSFEVGANYDRPIGHWGLSLVGLMNRRYYRNTSVDRDHDAVGSLTSIFNQATARDSGESIARMALTRDYGHAHHFEFSVETAYNTLDASLHFTQDTGGGPAVLTVPNSNVTVAEKRTEASASYTWRPSSTWTLEARLAREQSTLTFSGDSNQSVPLAYTKPSIQLSHTLAGGNQLHLRFYRDVGQLNFDDFVSASSVTDSLIAGGNPDLKPPTAWRLEFGGDLHFLHGFAVSFAATHLWIHDAADTVQVIAPGAHPGDAPIRFDAPGNIGNASENTLTSDITVPLSLIFPGARLTASTSYGNTIVTDPVTGRRRQASGQSSFCTNGEFRDDMNAQHLAWGFDFERCTENQIVRFNETDTNEEGPYVDWFIESTMIPGLKARAVLANSLNSAIRRQRVFYAPDRNGPLDHYDVRNRKFDDAPWLVVSLSGSF